MLYTNNLGPETSDQSRNMGQIGNDNSRRLWCRLDAEDKSDFQEEISADSIEQSKNTLSVSRSLSSSNTSECNNNSNES